MKVPVVVIHEGTTINNRYIYRTFNVKKYLNILNKMYLICLNKLIKLILIIYIYHILCANIN